MENTIDNKSINCGFDSRDGYTPLRSFVPNLGVSSNGRMTGSDSVHAGSIPATPAQNVFILSVVTKGVNGTRSLYLETNSGILRYRLTVGQQSLTCGSSNLSTSTIVPVRVELLPGWAHEPIACASSWDVFMLTWYNGYYATLVK